MCVNCPSAVSPAAVQSITVTVFTPGQQIPTIGTGTGNIINKGLTSDAVGGVSIGTGGWLYSSVLHGFIVCPRA